MSVQSN